MPLSRLSFLWERRYSIGVQDIQHIATALQRAGGRTFFVGGTVRDRLFGLPVKDYDLEVFGLPVKKIEAVMQQFGEVAEVGKAFGIIKVKFGHQEVDIAAPRRETKTGRGHAGFSVEIDPHLSPEQAARRRDFTINAMLEDPLTGELLDPYHGREDLHDRILRVVDSETFGDDPLRVLRACQFAARFDCSVADETLAQLKALSPATAELSRDRLREEWKKLFLLSEIPSVGLQLAMDIGLFDRFPAIAQLPDTPQVLQTHPEGDVWAHTLLTVDQAAGLVRRYHPAAPDRLTVLLAAFCHDFGKTVRRDAQGLADDPAMHAHAGVEPAKRWLHQNGFGDDQIAMVAKLVDQHLALEAVERVGSDAPDGLLRQLVNQIWPALPSQLLTVREAVCSGTRGRICHPTIPGSRLVSSASRTIGVAAWPTSDSARTRFARNWITARSGFRKNCGGGRAICGTDQCRPKSGHSATARETSAGRNLSSICTPNSIDFPGYLW